MNDGNLSGEQASKWIGLAQKNDLASFNQIVLTYQDAAFRLASWILNDDDCAEDAVQTAFLAAYRSISSFRGGSFRAWLLKIVRNCCLDELRHRKRHPWISLEPMQPDDREMENAHWLIDPGLSPEELLIQQEGWKKIEQILHQLIDPFREVVTLIDIEALDYHEAAAVLDIPVGTVKSRLARARARLRQVLREEQRGLIAAPAMLVQTKVE